MSKDASWQRALLGTMLDERTRSSVAIAREMQWPLVRTVRVCTLLAVRDLVERDGDGGFTITPAGIDFIKRDTPMPVGPAFPVTRETRRRPVRTARQKFWIAMRMKRRFTVHDLVEIAAEPDSWKSLVNARSYVRKLELAGYLVRIGKRVPGTSPASRGAIMFQLVRDTGETAPSAMTTGGIDDRNLDPPKPTEDAIRQAFHVVRRKVKA